MNNLMPKQNFHGLVEAHDKARRLAEEGFERLSQAKAIMSAAVGSRLDILMEEYIRDSDLESRYYRGTVEKMHARITSAFWNYLMGHQSGLHTILSTKRKEQFQKQLEGGEVPDFTLPNILQTVQGHMSSLDEYFLELVKEVHNWLRPWQRDPYKTNKKYEIGPKVIKTGMVNPTYGNGFTFSHWSHAEDRLRDLDRVFHLLDGKGVPKYPGDLATAIREAFQKQVTETETEYLRARWFKNNNMHIWFLRQDLLARFNAAAGGGTLKGEQ